MASNDRFYQLRGSRPFYWGDVGNRLQLSGFIMAGEDALALVFAPTMERMAESTCWVSGHQAHLLFPTVAEWCEIIKESDDPKVFELDATGGIKAIHRKMQKGSISGAVQQRIWARDGFCCQFCKRMMGEVQLSVDHFEPLEFGGSETQENLISACRKCNKRKGSIPAKQWCDKLGLDYDQIKSYLATSNVCMT